MKCDVLIAGGGLAGLVLAVALRQALGEPFRVVVADPALGRSHADDARASAIAASARRLLETIGVWDAVTGEAQPILDMVVTDSRLQDAVRPRFLNFGGEIEPGEPFAHMIPNQPLIATLHARAEQAGVTLRAEAVSGFTHRRDETASIDAPSFGVTATLSGGDMVEARLLVAADGARSRIREAAGIATVGWDYDQAGIVTTVAHEHDHHGRAEEHFLPAGPFAILPLTGKRSSIVWTEGADEARRLLALSDADFLVELERRFGLQLGDIAVAGPRRAYPLGLWVARTFIADRIALVGDAAHVIHPIAGQGLNLGLRDIAALAEAVTDAARLGLDIGAADVLDRYQRWRRFDTAAMGVATDGLNRLFSNGSDVLRLARDVGLGIVDRAPALKAMFIREAAGLTGDVPKLLRGERL